MNFANTNLMLSAKYTFRYLFILLSIGLVGLFSCKPKKSGETVFKLLPANETGVTFVNRNVVSDSVNILDYLYFYNGAGVATADFNNDGLPDLYFVSNQGPNKLYLNKGGMKFEDITDKAGVAGTGNWKTGVIVVDINGDGLKDIYVSVVSGYKTFKGKNQLYINNGNLTFTESAAKYGLDFAGLSTQVSFFDYDKDGDLDMFLLTSSVHSNDTYGDSTQRFKYSHDAGDHLFRNDNGHFTDVTAGSGIYSAPIGYGLGVSIGDLNNDGWDDIYVSNDFFEQDYYYVNQHNGTFKEKLKSAFGHTSLFSMGNTISDINKDGHLDVLSTDMLPEEMKVLRSTINDESLDIYNQEVNAGFYYQYSKNCLQLNVGNGNKFVDLSLYSGVSATDWTWSPLIQDFDMDGTKDMFFSNGIKRRLNDMDYLKYLGDPTVMQAYKENRVFDKEKINKMPEGGVHNYFYRGGDKLKFTDESSANDMNQASISAGAVAVDLDNDGDLDMVTNNMDEPAFIYKNTTIESHKENKPSYLNYAVKYNPLNRDGIGTKFFLKSKKHIDHQEIQTSNAYESNLNNELLFTFAPDDKPESLLVVWPDNSYQVIKDFKPGQKMIISYNAQIVDRKPVAGVIDGFISDKKQFDYKSVQSKLLATVKTFDTPDFNYYSLLPHTYLQHTPAVAVADVNNDGMDDIYVGGIADEEKYILAGNKSGGFNKIRVPLFDQDKNTADEQAVWADVNNDSKPDLIVISANHPFLETEKLVQPRLYLNKGNFQFEYKPLPKINYQASKITSFDFNGDGLNDILLTSAVSFKDYTAVVPSAILINKGNGIFEISHDKAFDEITNLQYVTSITTSDIDNNGKPDLLITAEWQPVYIFLNDGKKLKRFSSQILDKEKGWWQSAMITDVDGDGKADLIAGNWGLNNKYNVTPDQPLFAYNTDLDKDGKNDLILSYFYKDLYYPFRPKNDLEQELPYLKKEWLSYQKMADKTTSEIFKDKLDDTKRLSVNQFNSIFVSDVLHTASVRPLPYLYQQAPIKSILKDDGGNMLLNGNFWGVVPYEGKYDALGLVTLRYNKNNGVFENPAYLVNSSFNFQELSNVTPLKTVNLNSYLIVTYDGRLMLVNQ
ncbi:Repeat domain-containing protein [Mucilaginibacter gossypiicola]|uniref:Repeat domain-containing protein n=1 Tax=Mucilaginibacter gossypiicola TaxID=551995 RepID=A0A1H7ZSM2_9SPHI|nr:VCBS repeat-containing protein [Mucilaginibacter gossypiicola]SEM61435.1 Repeat domain-containing protein [Mucilaginibacter gossypiicola]